MPAAGPSPATGTRAALAAAAAALRTGWSCAAVAGRALAACARDRDGLDAAGHAREMDAYAEEDGAAKTETVAALETGARAQAAAAARAHRRWAGKHRPAWRELRAHVAVQLKQQQQQQQQEQQLQSGSAAAPQV
jgi:hypothetical protein